MLFNTSHAWCVLCRLIYALNPTRCTPQVKMRELGCLSHPQYKFVCMLDHKVSRSSSSCGSGSSITRGSAALWAASTAARQQHGLDGRQEVSCRPAHLSAGAAAFCTCDSAHSLSILVKRCELAWGVCA